jgi:hypothetical protein
MQSPENFAIFGFDKFDGPLLSKMMPFAFRQRIYSLSNGFDQNVPFMSDASWEVAGLPLAGTLKGIREQSMSKLYLTCT